MASHFELTVTAPIIDGGDRDAARSSYLLVHPAEKRDAGRPGYRRRFVLGAMFGIFLVTVPLVNPYLRGDGVGYYAYVRSAVIDHDLDFRDEFGRGDPAFRHSVFLPNGELRPQLRTSTGHVRNQWSVGPAILWAPFFLVAHSLVRISRSAGLHTWKADGYSSPYLLFTAAGTAFYAFAALLITAALAMRYCRSRPTLLAVLAIWGASSLPVYMYFLPFWSLAIGTFPAALLVYLWAKGPSWQYQRWLIFGSLVGLLFTIHPVAIAWAALPGASLVGLDRGRLAERGRAAVAGLVGGLIGVAPQAIVKWIVHGSPFDSGYLTKWQPWSANVIRVLFSSRHGLLSWTPVAALAVVGLVLMVRDASTRRTGIALLAVFLSMLYIVSAYASNEESSFGNRFFVLFTPGLVLGVAVLADRLWAHHRKGAIAAVCALTVWNGLFAFQWAWGMLPKRGSVNWATVVSNQFTRAPTELRHAAGLFVTDRQRLIREVQQRDLERIQAGTS